MKEQTTGDPVSRITVLLTTDQHRANKTFHRQLDGRIREQPYHCGYMFSAHAVEIDSIIELYELLQILESGDSGFLVQGEVVPQFRANEEITRTLLDIPDRNQIAMLRSVPDGSQWLCCDFDKIDLPANVTPQQGVEMLVHTLPPEFHDVTYAYQLSSSAGVNGIGVKRRKRVDDHGEEVTIEEEFQYPGWAKLNAHVFFWLSAKHRNLAQWAKNLNAQRGRRIIDPAPLEAVQPNYCAKPRFINMDDPVLPGDRSGLVRKGSDAVDLVWIDAPSRHVIIDEVSYKVGAHVNRDGRTFIATPSLQDRIAAIGANGEYRAPLKSAIGYYFWLRGNTADEQEIRTLIRTAPIEWGGRNYLGTDLDDLTAWFAARNTHDPLKSCLDDIVLARLIEWRNSAPQLPDADLDDTVNWVFDLEESGLQYFYIEGECGQGKTEWLIDRLASRKRRQLVCLPRIDMIREVRARLLAKYPEIEQTHLVHTIHSGKDDNRDEPPDEEDELAANSTTVTYQVQKFRHRTGNQRAVILFLTHAALLLSDWHTWTDFELYADEIPEPYVCQCRDFSNSGETLRKYIEPYDGETNYHRLGLTSEGYHKLGVHGHFDDNEQTLKYLMDAINRPNMAVFAHKPGWDQMTEQVMLMRLLHAGFVRYFRSVTIIGDEFRRSMLALAFANKYAVEWLPHPDWQPCRTRTVPLRNRARIFYFASKDELRGSVTGYESRQLVPKIISWFRDNVPEQTLITTNNRFKNLFDKPDFDVDDQEAADGVYRSPKGKKLDLLWVPPKRAGTDRYKSLTSVGFFAAMRPSTDEVSFVQKSLLIGQDEIINWREYNTLFQFVMRICLRLYDSDKIAKVFVYDEYQAEYLRERFGGCREFTHISGVLPAVKANKGGRPKKPDAELSASAQRKRRERDKRGKCGG